MNKETFMLIAGGLYLFGVVLIVVALNLINKLTKDKYKKQIEKLEREKNLVVNANMVTELNKVEALANNEELREKYELWKDRFKTIKEVDMSKIADEINEIETLFVEGKFKDLNSSILSAELDLNMLKTKADYLFNEIKDITLSEERNREVIIKLKSEYREITDRYNEDEEGYKIIETPLKLQFENVEKLFQAFESSMDRNAYTEVGRIVKALDDIISNLKVIIDETKPIVNLGKNLIPKRIEDIMNIKDRMTSDGYNLEYLNVEYNKNESEKKIQDIFQRLNVLNVEDSLFELTTIYDYFDSLYSDFDAEKVARHKFDDYMRSILIKATRLEKVNNELLKKIDDIKYSYDLADEDIVVIYELRDTISEIRMEYDKIIDLFRRKALAYTKLTKEMSSLNTRLLDAEEKLNLALKTLGGLKEDENRAREQLVEIKKILANTKKKQRSFKLPNMPKNYYVELDEAVEAINNISEELEKRPISIKTLNTRVDTARDLTLKVYNTINETIKLAKMAEVAIVYGNKYRVTNKEIDMGLVRAENAFYKGNFKNSIEHAINAINIIEPGIHNKLLEDFK